MNWSLYGYIIELALKRCTRHPAHRSVPTGVCPPAPSTRARAASGRSMDAAAASTSPPARAPRRPSVSPPPDTDLDGTCIHGPTGTKIDARDPHPHHRPRPPKPLPIRRPLFVSHGSRAYTPALVRTYVRSLSPLLLCRSIESEPCLHAACGPRAPAARGSVDRSISARACRLDPNPRPLSGAAHV